MVRSQSEEQEMSKRDTRVRGRMQGARGERHSGARRGKERRGKAIDIVMKSLIIFLKFY